MAELKNRFSWSTKRGSVFAECRRRYWFEYYGYWGGWNPNSDDRTRSIYVLKQLKGRHAWVGSHVHDAIDGALQLIYANLPADPDVLADEVVEKMRREFRESRDREYWDKPKKKCGLMEHEFDTPVSQEEWAEGRDKVRACLRNFFQSELLATLRGLDRDRWLEVEELATFEIVQGVPIFVKLDLAYRKDDGTLAIVDWKTGKLDRNPDPIQLTCYAMYASRKWDAPPDGIETTLVNLSANESIAWRLDQGQMDEARRRIVESIQNMRAYVDGPLEENNPKPEASFPVTESTASCRRCQFRRLCPDSPLQRL